MSWIGRLWSRVTSGETVGPRIVHVGRTAAGVHVDPDTALRNSTVWACRQYLCRTVAQLPWHVMRKDEHGNANVAQLYTDHLLNERPNPEMGSFSWREAMLGNALLWGNGYAEIQRTNQGLPTALWPIHPSRVTVRRDDEGGLLYDVWNKGPNVVLGPMDVFHLRGFGDGAVGYNVVEYAAQSIGWAQATELFGATYFGEGMNPSGIVKTKHPLSPEAMDLLKEDVDKLYAGPRGRRTAILDADMDFVKVTSTPEDSQFIETRQHQVEEICRWFGVPPHKVMHLLRATFSNIEHQAIEVVVDSVTPWVKAFEQEANHKLFVNRSLGFYTKMSMQALLRGDNASRAQFYKAMFELGMTVNQILALEDMNGIGPDGDVSFVSNNVQTLRRAIEGKPAPASADMATDPPAPARDPAARNGRGLLS